MKSTSKQYMGCGLILAALALQTGCSKAADGSAGQVAGTKAAPTERRASKLGDLHEFRSIAAEVAKLVQAGDRPAAKLRIKDLEIAWDRAEAGLKQRSAADWHVIDKAIDAALEALRAEPPSSTECLNKTSAMLQAFDSFAGAPG